jgi:SAM-dependent methyltransferase
MNVTTRTHLPIDYDEYAPTYAWSRAAVRWVLDPLSSLIATSSGRRILEIGCGTGNYVRALSDLSPGSTYFGVDLTFNMLREASSFGARVDWACGDASKDLPFADRTFHVAFAVDVVHHIEDIPRFFVETHPGLGGRRQARPLYRLRADASPP